MALALAVGDLHRQRELLEVALAPGHRLDLGLGDADRVPARRQRVVVRLVVGRVPVEVLEVLFDLH